MQDTCGTGLHVSDGKVFYTGDNAKGPRQVVTSKEEVLDILKHYHTFITGGVNTGVNTTREKISTRYFWHGMSEDIREYVSIKPVLSLPYSAPLLLYTYFITSKYTMTAIWYK